MNFPFLIAKRYLVSKKKQNIINIISGISVVGVATGTFALVVVLSVFNGFNDLIRSYFSTLDPDLKITAAEGKMFDPKIFTDSLLTNLTGLADYSVVIEENALLKYGARQYIATIKGVPENFKDISLVESLITDGSFTLGSDGASFAVIGQGVAGQLGISLNLSDPLHVYVPRKGNRVPLNMAGALNHEYIFPSGIFALLEEVDSRIVFVPLEFASRLFNTGNKVSAIEVRLDDPSAVKKAQNALLERTKGTFHIKDKYQQHDMLYKTMRSEKWATYLILVFILIIASFNILGSLSMLIVDKKEDITILRSMGAKSSLIRKIFLYEGWMITFTGVTIGLITGVLVCLVQIHFEILTLPGAGSFVISAYPVKIMASDLFFISLMVLSIGFIASWYPVRYISDRYKEINPAGK